mgnify:CR=1 FL=1
MKKISEEVKWAEGKRNSEIPKYTWWSGSRESSKLGGFTLTYQGKYLNSEVDGSVKITAHTSAGLSYWKHFDIPLDRVDEFCHALMKVKDFALKSEEHNE